MAAQEPEIRKIIGMRWDAFIKHSVILNSNFLLSLRRNVYTYCTLPMLAFDLETWGVTMILEGKLRSVQTGMELKLLGLHGETGNEHLE